jgi:DNA-binding NarL/FixJ family response regulator
MAPTRILIADDNRLIAEMLQSLLGMDPTLEIVGTAWNGFEALDLIEKGHPDILILDLSMPALDGFAVIRDLEIQQLPIHVIVFTACPTSDFRHTSLVSGIVDAMVSKIDSIENLLEIVHQVQSKIRVEGSREISRGNQDPFPH